MTMVKQFFLPWISFLSFLSIVAARLDEVILVTWFLVFIPLFFLDAVKMLFWGVHAYQHLRNGTDTSNTNTSMQHKLTAFLVWLLVLVFQVLLCVYLDDSIEGLRLYFVFIPLWIVLVIQIVALNHYQVRVVQKTLRTCSCS